MKRHLHLSNPQKVLFVLTLCFCALLLAAILLISANHAGNNLHSFSETVLTLEDGWTLTDSDGHSRDITLPETIEYGEDGRYTLTHSLPEVGGLLATPALEFYSNYVDVSIYIDGLECHSFPQGEAAFSGATGNTYHFVRMPTDYAGKTLEVKIRCQLGNEITYLLNPPLLGAKATMLKQAVMISLPSLTLAGCMSILAIGLGALYVAFHRRISLGIATLYTSMFTFMFSLYVYLENTFAQLLFPNGYLLCFITLSLLALVPIPLIGGFFLDAVSQRFKRVMYGLMLLCSLNFIVQMILNLSGTMSVRAMLPATHGIIVFSIIVAALSLIFSDRNEKPGARRSLLAALPMVVGGTADIILLSINRPSLNNCFWFACGVTFFIIIQLYTFISGYFTLYRSSLEARLLADMAYHDMLSGIDNRNAYERKLKELSTGEPSPLLCCIVADINDLKLINDRLGHRAGDSAIASVGEILREKMPEFTSYFRTGGDEFVVLLEGCCEQQAKALADQLAVEATKRGEQQSIPLNLAIGFGQYDPSDGNIIDFIRRVDTLMYQCKRRQKGEADILNACQH